MELSSQGPNELGEPAFDAHMDIFVFFLKWVTALTNSNSNPFESANDFIAFRLGEDFSFFQCVAMSNAATNIMMVQSAIKRKRGRKLFNQSVGSLLEPPAPGLRGWGRIGQFLRTLFWMSTSGAGWHSQIL